MKEVKILVQNITDSLTRPQCEAEIAAYLNAGWTITSSHTDFEMNGSQRVILLVVLLTR